MNNSTQGLRVVGPGGPYEAMVECAEVFSQSRNVPVEVIKGPPEGWLDQRADLIYGGFPQMLTDLAQAHPRRWIPGSTKQKLGSPCRSRHSSLSAWQKPSMRTKPCRRIAKARISSSSLRMWT